MIFSDFIEVPKNIRIELGDGDDIFRRISDRLFRIMEFVYRFTAPFQY